MEGEAALRGRVRPTAPILLTSKPMRVEIAKTIFLEGGYSDDPNDPGGETNFGISKRYHPNVDIKALTPEKAEEIYLKEYWNVLGCVDISSIRVRWKVFDISVTSGQVTAAKMLQRSVKISDDGHVGPITIKTVNRYLQSSIGEACIMSSLKEQHVKHFAQDVVNNPHLIGDLMGLINRGFQGGDDLR